MGTLAGTLGAALGGARTGCDLKAGALAIGTPGGTLDGATNNTTS